MNIEAVLFLFLLIGGAVLTGGILTLLFMEKTLSALKSALRQRDDNAIKLYKDMESKQKEIESLGKIRAEWEEEKSSALTLRNQLEEALEEIKRLKREAETIPMPPPASPPVQDAGTAPVTPPADIPAAPPPESKPEGH